MSTPKSEKSEFILWPRIEGLLRERQMTAKRLAEIADVAPSAVVKWKKGAGIGVDKLKKIAFHFGVSVDWLLGSTDNMEPKGQILKIGSVRTRELLAYRDVSTEWLEREAASLMENLPTSAKGRGRLSLIRRIMEMLVELQERCVDEWTGEKRKPDGTRNVGPWADVEAYEKAKRR
jgi:transcriptional regulator with XRE-family HTH domain